MASCEGVSTPEYARESAKIAGAHIKPVSQSSILKVIIAYNGTKICEGVNQGISMHPLALRMRRTLLSLIFRMSRLRSASAPGPAHLRMALLLLGLTSIPISRSVLKSTLMRDSACATSHTEWKTAEQ